MLDVIALEHELLEFSFLPSAFYQDRCRLLAVGDRFSQCSQLTLSGCLGWIRQGFAGYALQLSGISGHLSYASFAGSAKHIVTLLMRLFSCDLSIWGVADLSRNDFPQLSTLN